jgi:methylenetetrahydrofolate reductase (NADPH)
MAKVVDMGLHEQVPILAGLGPIRSLKGATFMADNIAGMDVPDYVFDRFRGLSDDDQAKAGLDLCCEIGEQVMAIDGVRGLHIMAVGWPAAVPDIVENLGLHPRPELTDAVLPPEIAEPT